MARTYWRVSPAFWSDEKVTGAEGGEPWSDDTKMLAMYLLTCKHRTVEGLFLLPKEYIVADLRWSAKRLAQPFARLLAEGFIEYDDRARLCFLVNALEYQAPENPNQVTAAMRYLGDLPKSDLLGRLLEQAERLCQPLAERLREGFDKGLPEGFAKPPTPSPSPSTTPVRAGTREAVDNFSRKGGGRGGTDLHENPGADRLPHKSEPEPLGTLIGAVLGAPPDDFRAIDLDEGAAL
jgi:hypothetical protein